MQPTRFLQSLQEGVWYQDLRNGIVILHPGRLMLLHLRKLLDVAVHQAIYVRRIARGCAAVYSGRRVVEKALN